jgi:hypothetical protein
MAAKNTVIPILKALQRIFVQSIGQIDAAKDTPG